MRGEVQLLRLWQEEEAEKLMVDCFSKNFIDYEASKPQSSSVKQLLTAPIRNIPSLPVRSFSTLEFLP